MKTVTPNAVLLRRTLDWIEKHPEEHDQTTWRCKTGMCFAGHAVTLAGGRWAFNAASDPNRAAYLHAVQGDDPHQVRFIGGHRVIKARDRAQRILGLSDERADDLFDASNCRVDLREMVDDLCEVAS